MTHLFEKPAEGHRQRRTKVWAVPILVFALFIIGQLLVLLPADAMGLVSKETVETYPTVLYMIFGTFAAAGLLFVLWIRLFERRSLGSAGVDRGPRVGSRYLGGFGSGILMAAVIVFGVRACGGYTVETEASLASADLIPIGILMGAFMLQSFVEEFVFRGWMLARIAERYGLVAGVIGNSALFTAMHVDGEILEGVSVDRAVIFVSGMVLFSVFASLLVIRQGSVWGAAAWHASWNWIFITGFGLPTTGIELGLAPLIVDYQPAAGAADWLTGGAEGPEGSFLMPVVLALGCLAVVWFRRPRS